MDGNVFGPTLQVWASVVVRVDLLMAAPQQSRAILGCVLLVEHPFTHVLHSALRPSTNPCTEENGGIKTGYQAGQIRKV